MRPESLLPALLLLAACGEKTPVDTSACTVAVDETFPTEGATDAYIGGRIEFRLSDDDASATVALADASGADVPGEITFNADQDAVFFTPSAPLQPLSAYTATLTFCGGQSTLGFTTSDLGQARTASPLGSTYVVTLKTARFTDPESLSGIMTNALKLDVLLQVMDLVDATSLQFLGTVSKEGATTPEQDFCGATMDFGTVDFAGDPTFKAGPLDATFYLPTHNMVINGLQIQGTFTADATSFGGGVLDGQLDARNNLEMYQLMGLDVSTPDDVCEALGSFDVTCEPCPDGQVYCMTIRADSITAPAVAGLALETVDVAHCDPRCETPAEDCE